MVIAVAASEPLDLIKFAKNQLIGSFTDFADQLQSGVPEYILSGTPSSLIGQISLATNRNTCRSWAREGGPPQLDELYAGYCEPYLTSIGEWPGDRTLDPPFSGGQCVTDYTVEVGFTSIISGNPSTLRSTGNQGPIKSISFEEGPPGSGSFPGSVSLSLTVTSDDGSVTNVSTGNCTPGSAGGITVSRDDGLPDVCGDPPPEFGDRPNTPATPLPPVSIPTPGGDDLVIDVQVNPDGSITFCAGDDCITFNPLDTGNGGNPNPFGPSAPGDKGQPGTPETVGAGETAEGQAGDDEYLVGVLVELVSTSGKVNKQPSSTFTVYRASCYVYLGTEGALDQQPEAASVIFPQFFYAPEGSTHYAVRINPGYTLKVTPYYKTFEV